jgi:hypothetical protein
MTISRTFADLLRSRRGTFNQQFARVRWEYPNLQSAGFLALLEDVLDPLVVALAERTDPSVLPGAVETLYALLLELYALHLVGEKRRMGWVQEGWEELLPSLAPQLALAPGRVAAAVSNALVNLKNADPERWIHRMKALGNIMNEPDHLLAAGKVLGWRCGLAQYRDSALALAESLPEDVIRRIFDLPQEMVPAEALRRMRGDPWWRPDDGTRPDLEVVRIVGDFTGFGGVFETPPVVFAQEGRLLARDAARTWQVFADSFGTAFQPAEGPARAKPDRAANLEQGGWLQYRGQKCQVPGLEALSSSAALAHTLAVTQPFSHRIHLIHI